MTSFFVDHSSIYRLPICIIGQWHHCDTYHQKFCGTFVWVLISEIRSHFCDRISLWVDALMPIKLLNISVLKFNYQYCWCSILWEQYIMRLKPGNLDSDCRLFFLILSRHLNLFRFNMVTLSDTRTYHTKSDSIFILI